MRKTTDRELKSEPLCKILKKKQYTRPELAKREKLQEVTGGGAPPPS